RRDPGDEPHPRDPDQPLRERLALSARSSARRRLHPATHPGGSNEPPSLCTAHSRSPTVALTIFVTMCPFVSGHASPQTVRLSIIWRSSVCFANLLTLFGFRHRRSATPCNSINLIQSDVYGISRVHCTFAYVNAHSWHPGCLFVWCEPDPGLGGR